MYGSLAESNQASAPQLELLEPPGMAQARAAASRPTDNMLCQLPAGLEALLTSAEPGGVQLPKAAC